MGIIGQLTLDQVSIVEVDADPSASAAAAPIGSIATLYDGTNARLWIKTASADTGWTPIPRLATGITALTANRPVYTDVNGFVQTITQAVWDGAGRFGFGTNAPAVPQSTLHLDRGTGTGVHIRFTNGTTTGVTAGDGFEVGTDDAGNAEIKNYENNNLSFFTNNIRYLTLANTGQTILGNSSVPIDITGLSAFPQFQILGLGAVQMAQIQYSADTIAPVFNAIKSRGVNIGDQGILLANDELGRFQFRGSDGVNFQAGASVRALVDGTPGAGSMPGRLIMMTTPTGTTTPVERMRISANGHVRVVDSLQMYRSVLDFQTQAAANTTTTLNTSSASIQYFTGATAGQIVRLPDATTLVVGQIYEIRNANTTTTLAVQDSAGNALDVTPAVTGNSVCHLIDNSTAAGVWVVRTRFEPYVNEVSATASQIVASTTDVAITGMTITPPAGTYRVTFETPVTMANNGATLGMAVYAGGTINANSNKTFTSIGTVNSGTQYYGTTGTVTVNGSQAIEIRGRRSAGNATFLVRTMQITRVG